MNIVSTNCCLGTQESGFVLSVISFIFPRKWLLANENDLAVMTQPRARNTKLKAIHIKDLRGSLSTCPGVSRLVGDRDHSFGTHSLKLQLKQDRHGSRIAVHVDMISSCMRVHI